MSVQRLRERERAARERLIVTAARELAEALLALLVGRFTAGTS